MELEGLQEKLGDETFTQLETFVNDLVGQRDQARNESISGRRGLKEKVATLETQQTELLERLGVESVDDISELPDVAGMADANRQVEAKVKRLERLLGDTEKALGEERGLRKTSSQKAAVSAAMSKHDFIGGDVINAHIERSLVWEGDDLLFKTAEGNLVSVSDGVAGVAKAHPELLKPSGAGGAGVRSNNARGSDDQQVMDRADFEALPPAKQMELAKSGVELH